VVVGVVVAVAVPAVDEAEVEEEEDRDLTGILSPAEREWRLLVFYDFFDSSSPSDSQKKVHQGWGGDEATTELKAEEGAVADAAADSGAAADLWGADAAAPTDWAAPADGDAAVPAAEGDAKPEGRPRREREPEEDDNTLTLEQYLAQQKEKDAVVPKLESTRKANEGAGDDLWKDAVALSKNEEEEYFAGKVRSMNTPKSLIRLISPFRPRTLPRPSPRRRTRSSSKLMLALSALTADVDVDAAVTVVATVVVVARGVDAVDVLPVRMVLPRPTSTTKTPSLPSLRRLVKNNMSLLHWHDLFVSPCHSSPIVEFR
jgi:Hyaluronan / mRNA binding family